MLKFGGQLRAAEEAGAGRDPGRACGERPWTAGAAWGQAQDKQLSAATPRTTADNPDRCRQRHPDHKVNSIGARLACWFS
jgi:hypothetical protein